MTSASVYTYPSALLSLQDIPIKQEEGMEEENDEMIVDKEEDEATVTSPRTNLTPRETVRFSRALIL